jgi:iterative type I PKS product template protein
VVHEALDEKTLTGNIIIQSDLTQSKLLPVITGHVVNGRVLTPGVLYAEIAMTVGDYLWKTLVSADDPVGLNVCEFDVHKPLMVEVPPRAEGQHIQVECTAKLSERIMDVHVRSVTPEGKTLADIGKGLLKFEDRDEWVDQWERQKFLVQGQIEQLRHRFAEGKAHQILRKLAYILFEQLVEYSPLYQGMQQVVLDGQEAMGFAKIKLQYVPGKDGNFFLSPFAIDNLCHLSGFICNATDVISEEPFVFISHGWESLKFLAPEDISPEKEYTSLVKMVLGEKNICSGDVYVLDDESGHIVAVLYGLKFQGIPQRLIDVLLPGKRRVKFKDDPQ